MTPKEKATELVEKMYQKFDTSNYQDFDIDESDNDLNNKLWERNNDLYVKIYKTYAKQCALIAVDEIIDELTSRDILSGFWYEVHEEIKKL